MIGEAPVWVLLGQRTGDNNQLLRLASELGLPFRTLDLSYNRLHLLSPRLLGASLASLDPRSNGLIAPPWPRLVLGIGHRSVPIALAIRSLSGGKARLVRLGNPRLDPARFDLVVTTAQYEVRDAPNVLKLPVGISTVPKLDPTPEERDWLDRLDRPHRLLLIGGDTFMWTLRAGAMAAAARALADKPGSVIAVGSGRSRGAVLEAVAAALGEQRHAFVRGGFPRYPILIADADEIYVTGDSVAMLSDAIATGKPVGMIEPSNSLAGKIFYGLHKLGAPVPVRDIRRFWAGIREKAGTVERPVAGSLDVQPLQLAAAAIRRLLG